MPESSLRLAFVLVGTASIHLLTAVSVFWAAVALGEVVDAPLVLVLCGLVFPFCLLSEAAAALSTAAVLAVAGGGPRLCAGEPPPRSAPRLQGRRVIRPPIAKWVRRIALLLAPALLFVGTWLTFPPIALVVLGTACGVLPLAWLEFLQRSYEPKRARGVPRRAG